MNLFADFLTNDSGRIHKWTHYFPVYERHFAQWKNRSLFFLEIGVFGGGSLQMWQRYFGPYAKILGVDIEPACKEYEKPGIFVRIGDQSDPAFLQSIIDEFGIPDVVLDDGSHHMDHVNASFDFFYPKMGKNGIYMVEDLHTAYWESYGGGIDKPTTFINRTKGFIDQLHARYSDGKVSGTPVGRSTAGICIYDSIVVLEKGEIKLKQALVTGE